MRRIKLRAIYHDEILIGPPKNNSVEIDRVREKLRGRTLRKNSIFRLNQEREEVRALSDFSHIKQEAPNSPLLRKHTARTFNLTMVPGENPIKSLLTGSKSIRLEFYEEMQRKRADNIETEDDYKRRVKRISEKISNLTSEIATIQKKEMQLRHEIRTNQEEHEKVIYELNHKEATIARRLNEARQRKSVIGVQDKLFIEKERAKSEKQAIVTDFLKQSEKNESTLKETVEMLDNTRHNRRKLKKNLHQLKDDLIQFYCTVLKQGIDLREDGIRWVIKALWKMDESIPLSYFPKYLNDDSAQYLLTLAKKEIDFKELNERLNKHRLRLSGKAKETFRKSSIELYQTVQDRLRNLSKNVKCTGNLSIDNNNSEDYTGKASKRGDLVEIRESMMKLREEMEIITKNEIARVKKEFNSRTSTVTLDQVLICLFGERYKSSNKTLI